MCNEVVYYGNTLNVDGKLFTTGQSGAANYLQAYLGNQTIPWLTRAAAAAAQGGKPFFAYLAPHAPHFPAEPAPWWGAGGHGGEWLDLHDHLDELPHLRVLDALGTPMPRCRARPRLACPRTTPTQLVSPCR